MRDFNFFEPYLVQHKGNEKKKMTFYGIAALTIAVIIVFPVFNLIYAHYMKKDVSSMKTILESSEAKEKVRRVEEKQAKFEEIKKIIPIVTSRDIELQKKDIINEQFIQTIVDSIPVDLQFISLNIASTEISISGKARDKSSIAELAYNLRTTNRFENIFIPNISSNEGLFDFYLQFTIKDVN